MSSAEKKHDYHLVDPSPWPIFCSFASLIVCIGAVYYFTTKNLWLTFVGLAILFYGAFMWFREVVIEAEHKGDHTPVVQISHRYGMVLFIASEVMFFVAWFWAYFDASLFPDQVIGGVWPPKDIQTLDPWHIPLINTLLLLTSSVTVTIAHWALKKNQRGPLCFWLFVTVVLGAAFMYFQVYEYIEAYRHLGLTLGSGVYGATFFMLTGFHGAHVTLGTIMLLIAFLRSLKGHFNSKDQFGFEAAAWYWHFVDVVWVGLFLFVYVLD